MCPLRTQANSPAKSGLNAAYRSAPSVNCPNGLPARSQTRYAYLLTDCARSRDKTHILEEIKRAAKENDGQPLGKSRFLKAPGIKESDWKGKYWGNFGDAQEEAGSPRNSKQGAYDEVLLIEKFIALIRELKRFPTIRADCNGRAGYEDVLAICDSASALTESAEPDRDSGSTQNFGFVYLRMTP